jgi:two-component system, OmpR family, sensor histidine kinase KdpD
MTISIYPAGRGKRADRVKNYVLAVAATACCTALAMPLAGRVDLINIVMIYLLGATMSGLLLGRGPSALTAVANILAFDFFFVPPVFSLLVIDRGYLVTFAVMLSVALIIANLMATVRERTEAVAARERYTSVLYAITRCLAVERDEDAMVMAAVDHIARVLPIQARVVLSGANYENTPELNASPEAARWSKEHAQRAGWGTQRFSGERTQYLPLCGSHGVVGILLADGHAAEATLIPEQQRLLESVCDQLALALERARLANAAHTSQLAAERAALRNTLLTSISHDLRTPLSAIAGAGSIVAQSDFALDLYRRITLGKLIEDKARDMSDLITNVLELVRLESGVSALRRDWHDVEDLVGLAIGRNAVRLAGWTVTTRIPETLPSLLLDCSLVSQALSNLLENATKYTPTGTRIEISAQQEPGGIRLTVEDSGPGLGTDLPEKLFDKFVRGRSEGNIGGIGLGLTICRTVARLHGGDIHARASLMGGARFDIVLPFSGAGSINVAAASTSFAS